MLRGRGIRAHLRSCPDCSRFKADLEQRPRALKALVPPLPIGAAAALLAELLGVGHGGQAARVRGDRRAAAARRSRSRCATRARRQPPPVVAEATPKPKPKRDPKPPPVVVPAVATSEPQPDDAER